jgi:hypothetical protein
MEFQRVTPEAFVAALRGEPGNGSGVDDREAAYKQRCAKAWLAALPTATLLQQINPEVEDGLSLSVVRARTKKLQNAVEVLKRVPILPSDIREKVQACVQGLTRPVIGGIGAGEALRVEWPTELHALLAFLQPDVLVDRLMLAINQIANSPCALPEREQQIADLQIEIDRLHRTEEAIVVATGCATRAGLPAMGRAGCQGHGGARRPRRLMPRWGRM